MPKDDNGGLLSKVVRFVKNPTTNWADLDQKDTDRESTYSKQMLKEMIERKRRNDFVRKREFDMLRKMRRREAMSGQDPAARPSFFQSSLPSKPDDRAMTLKKIDEIEAQMSMQWWKTKNADSSVRTTNFPAASEINSDIGSIPAPSQAPGKPLPPAASYARTDPAPLSMVKAAQQPATPASPATPSPPVARTGPGPAVAPVAAARQPTPTAAPAPAAAPRDLPPLEMPGSAPRPAAPAPAKPPARPPLIHGLGGGDPGATGFSASQLFAVDVGEIAHDPELEEASIRFANGDDAGAEAGLLEALGPRGTRAMHEDTWFTLFDLYRATGQQDRFEAAAIDFAGRFGRSAPQWFSMPEIVGRMATAPAASAGGGTEAQPPTWASPQSLGPQSVALLNTAVGRAAPPWRLDWSKLKAIEPGAVEPLRKLLAAWASQPGTQLRFMAPEQFESVLQAATPSGDRAVAQELWSLRMEALRVMHRPDEFELVALDYCVTYEVSPPSWEPARCEYKPLTSEGGYVAGHTIIGEAFHDSVPSSASGFGDTRGTNSAQMTQMAAVELAGQIQGDATAALETLETRLLGADIMVISCAKLIRVDFSAAGTLLNWVNARHAEGRQVQFSDVHRLVAAFFNVIGISEHARVVSRID